MSFRYTNHVTGLWTQRLALQRATEDITLRTYVGRSTAGVEVRCSAYGQLLSITVDDAAKPAFVDAKSGNVRAAPLAQAVRGALFDANLRVKRDKEEAYRESLRAAPQLSADDHVRKSMWTTNTNALAPRCFDSIRDEPFVDALRAQQQQQQVPPAAGKPASASTTSVFGEIRAAKRHTMAGCAPDQAGALLQLEDEVLRAEKQRMRLDDCELAFWQRVDLIRKAQLNVIGPRKRRYEEFEVTSKSTGAGDFEEKLKISFARGGGR